MLPRNTSRIVSRINLSFDRSLTNHWQIIDYLLKGVHETSFPFEMKTSRSMDRLWKSFGNLMHPNFLFSRVWHSDLFILQVRRVKLNDLSVKFRVFWRNKEIDWKHETFFTSCKFRLQIRFNLWWSVNYDMICHVL